jgi:hypothetical protein
MRRPQRHVRQSGSCHHSRAVLPDVDRDASVVVNEELSRSLSSSPCFVLASIQHDLDGPDDIERPVGIRVLGVGPTASARTTSPPPPVCFFRQVRPPRRCGRAQPRAGVSPLAHAPELRTAEVRSCGRTGVGRERRLCRRSVRRSQRQATPPTESPAEAQLMDGRTGAQAPAGRKASSVQTGERVAATPVRKATSK